MVGRNYCCIHGCRSNRKPPHPHPPKNEGTNFLLKWALVMRELKILTIKNKSLLFKGFNYKYVFSTFTFCRHLWMKYWNFALFTVSLYWKMCAVNNWLDGAREDLVDMFIVHTMEEIQVRYFELISQDSFYFIFYTYFSKLVFRCVFNYLYVSHFVGINWCPWTV